MIKRVLVIIGLVSMGLAAWPDWDAGTSTMSQGTSVQKAGSRRREATTACNQVGLAGELRLALRFLKLPGMLPPCTKSAPLSGTPPATHKLGGCRRGNDGRNAAHAPLTTPYESKGLP